MIVDVIESVKKLLGLLELFSNEVLPFHHPSYYHRSWLSSWKYVMTSVERSLEMYLSFAHAVECTPPIPQL